MHSHKIHNTKERSKDDFAALFVDNIPRIPMNPLYIITVKKTTSNYNYIASGFAITKQRRRSTPMYTLYLAGIPP